MKQNCFTKGEAKMNPEQFQQALAERGINLSDAQMKQFAEYYDLLVATNEHVN